MAGQLTIDTLKASSGVLATQNGMTGIAKAWVNFNGSTAAIRGSFNVSSITKNGTGDYFVNYTTSMPDTNYAMAAATGNSGNQNDVITVGFYDGISPPETTRCRLTVATRGYTMTDQARVLCTIFSN